MRTANLATVNLDFVHCPSLLKPLHLKKLILFLSAGGEDIKQNLFSWVQRQELL
jgi:hypothetical protein